MTDVNEQTSSTNSKDTKSNDAEIRNKALRQKYEREMVIFEEQSNAILDGVREKGVSTSSDDVKKKLPEMITDIHILFSRQKPEYVFEGVDTSDELEKELNQTLEDKIKEEASKKKEEKKTDSSSSDSSSSN